MSYDISLEIQSGSNKFVDIETWNPTYNIGPMFRSALGHNGIHVFNGMRGSDAVQLLEKAIEDIEQNYIEYEKLNPPNGWWSVETLEETLRSMKRSAEENNLCIFRTR